MDIWIPLISVFISVLASVIITTFQSRIEITKLKRQLEQQYAKSLFDKRLESYPKLYKLLSDYAKKLQYKKNSVKNLIQFRDSLDEWNSENAILFTESTARLSGKFRHYLDNLLSNGENSKILDEDFRDIWSIIGWFEQTIKVEIGILDTLPPGAMKEKLDEVYRFIDEKRGKLKVSSDEIRELSPPWRQRN